MLILLKVPALSVPQGLYPGDREQIEQVSTKQ